MAPQIESVTARPYTVPTERPESDGTLAWDSTTLVYVEIRAGGATGIGYTYGSAAIASYVNSSLTRKLIGTNALDTNARWAHMIAAIRNDGRAGIAAMAVSALDVALWDLKGKLLGVPACALLGIAREKVPLYGSGGFTSYDVRTLCKHMARWTEMGIPRVKMKVGRDPHCDAARVAAVRRAIGDRAELFVDANGAYAVKQALEFAQAFAEECVTWFEEPVYHRDLEGNAFVREHAPPAMEISNGEYGYAPDDFTAILQAKAADVVQADVTRCGGLTGFLLVDALCEAFDVPLSSHCAPYATLHAAAAAKRLRHMEYFYDHVRIENMLFDGAGEPRDGALHPDLSRTGIGLELRRSDAERYAA